MAAKKNVKMRVLLGKDDMHDVPLLAGALDEETYDAIHDSDWETLVTMWKRRFDTAIYAYEWREVWITVPAEALKRVFEPRPIAAEVEA